MTNARPIVLTLAAGMLIAAWACGGSAESNNTPTNAPDANVSANGDATAEAAANDASTGCATEACTKEPCEPYGSECTAPRCPQVSICGDAMFSEQNGAASTGGGTITYSANAEATANARCVVTALRDGKVGRFHWGYTHTYGSHDETVDIVSGRKAFGEYSYSYDSPGPHEAYTNRPLKPAAWFDDCLAKDTADAFAKCLKDMFEEC
jgi:hypothetical protein